MTDKHLKLLDFILPILSEKYDGSSLSNLTHQYKASTGIKFSYTEEQHFLDLYKYQYFEYIERTNDYIKITSDTKSMIDKYGSLSKCLDEENRQILERQSKIVEKENLEIELAKSNIEANKLNKIIADQNKKNKTANTIATWINVVIGLINIAIIIWQLMKVE